MQEIKEHENIFRGDGKFNSIVQLHSSFIPRFVEPERKYLGWTPETF